MKSLLITAAFSAFALFAFSQNDAAVPSSNKIKPRLAKITTMDGNQMKGWLMDAGEDSVYLYPAYLKPNAANLDSRRVTAMYVPGIKSVRTHRKNAALRGALIGLVSGAALGAITGYASGDDKMEPYTGTAVDLFVAFANAFRYTKEEKAVMGATGLGLTGAITGAIIGAVAKKKFTIGGDKQSYKAQRQQLKIRSLTQ